MANSFPSAEYTEDSDDSESEVNEKEIIEETSSKSLESSSMEEIVSLSGELSSKPMASIQKKWISAANRSVQFRDDNAKELPVSGIEMQELPLRRQNSLVLSGSARHAIFLPKRASLHMPQNSSKHAFANLVDNVVEYKKELNSQLGDLKERQLEFNCHTQATKEILKDHTEEYINHYDGIQSCKPKLTLKDVSKKVTERLNAPKMASVVIELLHQREQDLEIHSDEIEQKKMPAVISESHDKSTKRKWLLAKDAVLGNVVPISVENLRIRRRVTKVSNVH